jgi:hypothetical protein
MIGYVYILFCLAYFLQNYCVEVKGIYLFMLKHFEPENLLNAVCAEEMGKLLNETRC